MTLSFCHEIIHLKLFAVSVGIIKQSENIEMNKLQIKQKLYENIWEILGTGITVISSIYLMLSLFVLRKYAYFCSEFYGVDKKYFDGTEVLQDRVAMLISVLLICIYFGMLAYTNKKMESKMFRFIFFFVCFLLFLKLNNDCIVAIIEGTSCLKLKELLNNYITVIVLVGADLIILFWGIIRPFCGEKSKCRTSSAIIFGVALIIFMGDVGGGFLMQLNYKISNKKSYEVFEENNVIITNYEGKFLVMPCEIKDNTLIIRKGEYSLQEMKGQKITYQKYDSVICEE